MTLVECIAAGLLATFTYLTAPVDIQQNLREQAKPGALLTAGMIEYSSWMVATAAHEYGHANIAQRLGGGETSVHLGAPCSDTKQAPWVQLGQFHIEGFNPSLGYTNYSTINQHELRRRVREHVINHLQPGRTVNEDLKKLLASELFAEFTVQSKLSPDDRHKILFIGGLCGTMARIAMQVVTEGSFTPDFIIVHELFNSLLPLAPGSDAYIIWQERFELSDEQLDKILYLTTLLDISACVYFTVKDKRNAPHAPLYTTSMLGLINYFIRGYGRFYAGSNSAVSL